MIVMKEPKIAIGIGLIFCSIFLPGCSGTATTTSNSQNNVASNAKSASTESNDVTKNIATFDTLDFDVFSHQKWDRFPESHSKDIVVHWPDGHTTTGLEKHIEDMKYMFTYAPDTRIT